MTTALSRLRQPLRRLGRDTRAVAMLEFALAAPIVLSLGVLATETTNLAIVNMRMSQVALNLADNISRVGDQTIMTSVQVRESDVNESLAALTMQGTGYNLTKRGRVVLSSLEKDPATGKQYIHWQRCIGAMHYDSTYGAQGDGLTAKLMPQGMGPSNHRIMATDNYAVMFVELTYDYDPVVSERLLGPQQLHFTAAFISRDKRNLPAGLKNDATASTCDKYAETTPT